MNKLDTSFESLSRVRALPVKSQLAIVGAAALVIIIIGFVMHLATGSSDTAAVREPVPDGSFRPTKAQ